MLKGEDDYLAVYLNDHLAGATAGRDLARRMAATHTDGALAPFLQRLAAEVEEDRQELADAMARLGVRENRVKQTLAWTGERVRRLKLNERLFTPSPMTVVIELEAMALGVEGKFSLWRSLERAGLSGGLDLERLIDRARSQRAGLEHHRLEAADSLLAQRESGARRATAVSS
jgi:hypothetical protein